MPISKYLFKSLISIQFFQLKIHTTGQEKEENME